MTQYPHGKHFVMTIYVTFSWKTTEKIKEKKRDAYDTVGCFAEKRIQIIIKFILFLKRQDCVT